MRAKLTVPRLGVYLLDRGFTPGVDDIANVYAAVLVGQSQGSRSAEDPNGMSVTSTISQFNPGREHYRNAQRFLGIAK